MSYHEAFWLATSAAAPVIALAAVVAVPDAAAAQRSLSAATRPDRMPLGEVELEITQEGRRFWYSAVVIYGACIFNVLFQAALLGLSLSSLATTRNWAAPWVAIFLAVGGILLLALSVTKSATLRRRADSLHRSDVGQHAQVDGGERR